MALWKHPGRGWAQGRGADVGACSRPAALLLHRLGCPGTVMPAMHGLSVWVLEGAKPLRAGSSWNLSLRADQPPAPLPETQLPLGPGRS